MAAPELFVAWTCNNVANDHKFGRKIYRYHPRSDEHSKKLCKLVLADLVEACPLLQEHAKQGKVVAGINAEYTSPSGKVKVRDLALGVPSSPVMPIPMADAPICTGNIGRLLLSLEAKQCMTEHSKTKPRLFDELSSSHQIVHHSDPDAIAAGIVVVNIAKRYASPTRQVSGEGPPTFTDHKQPHVTTDMVKHLEGLQMRSGDVKVGFDAFATVIIDCDNVGACTLHTGVPAPQEGQEHHYGTFIRRMREAYEKRFSGL